MGWSFSYGCRWQSMGQGDVTITQEDGSTVTFAPMALVVYVRAPRVLASLVQNATAAHITRSTVKSNICQYLKVKVLTGEQDRNGYATSAGPTRAVFTKAHRSSRASLTYCL